mgnify:CR=1 FL=1
MQPRELVERHVDVLMGLAYPLSVLEEASERALGRNILFGGLLAELVPGGHTGWVGREVVG